MVGVVDALLAIASDDVPEVADAELIVEPGQSAISLHTARGTPWQRRHRRGRYRIVTVVADRPPRSIGIVQPDPEAGHRGGVAEEATQQ
ncbi:hypothetical protein G6F59_017775 [Rhizopus arrhizus]|nr:hypothetical protein G6F59_017775 [Rhizopus arrhizus]